jgi:hypothetical protein
MLGMDEAAVVGVLAAAAASASLPRLGGMARLNGVAIVSDRVRCFSHVGGGPLLVRPMLRPQSPLTRLPFLRGVISILWILLIVVLVLVVLGFVGRGRL